MIGEFMYAFIILATTLGFIAVFAGLLWFPSYLRDHKPEPEDPKIRPPETETEERMEIQTAWAFDKSAGPVPDDIESAVDLHFKSLMFGEPFKQHVISFPGDGSYRADFADGFILFGSHVDLIKIKEKHLNLKDDCEVIVGGKNE